MAEVPWVIFDVIYTAVSSICKEKMGMIPVLGLQEVRASILVPSNVSNSPGVSELWHNNEITRFFCFVWIFFPLISLKGQVELGT